MEQTKYYRFAFEQLSTFNPDEFSLTNAVYLVENAYINNKISYPDFIRAIKQRADFARQIIKREKLNSKDNLSLNFAIQELFKHSNSYYNSQSKQSITIPPIKYDFTDFQGQKDYRQVMVTKMLATGSGQCHSMPLGYLMIAEQLGAKAWLSLAPQHSFIQFKDGRGRLTLFETTNGNYVSSSWMIQSGFINAKALQNHSYLDTLSSRQLYAECLADLLLGYLHKFGYDDYADNIRQSIVKMNPANMIAAIVDAQHKQDIALRMLQKAGRPSIDKLPNYPEAYSAYLSMQEAIEKVDNLGYQDMPAEAYAKWLQSIESEKKKQQNKALNEQMAGEIHQLRMIKTPLKTTIKK